jgi:hypothetical protein
MSGGGSGNDEANRLLEEQIRQQKEEIEQKRQAIVEQRMAIIQGQGAQSFNNPDNPNP